MLITICYSVLTWIQSRQRKEILVWVQDCCLKDPNTSLLLIRERSFQLCNSTSLDLINGESGNCSYYNSPSSTLRRDFSINNSTTSTPSKSCNTRQSMDTQSMTSLKQSSDLCYNHIGVQRTRLLWEEDEMRVLVLSPQVRGPLVFGSQIRIKNLFEILPINHFIYSFYFSSKLLNFMTGQPSLEQ